MNANSRLCLVSLFFWIQVYFADNKQRDKALQTVLIVTSSRRYSVSSNSYTPFNVDIAGLEVGHDRRMFITFFHLIMINCKMCDSDDSRVFTCCFRHGITWPVVAVNVVNTDCVGWLKHQSHLYRISRLVEASYVSEIIYQLLYNY